MRSTRNFISGFSLVAAFALPGAAHADLAACAGIGANDARLACYDTFVRGGSMDDRAARGAAPATPAPAGASTRGPAADNAAPVQAGATEIERRWELRRDLKQGVFRLTPYRPVYAMLHLTNSTNDSPSSPTRSVDSSDVQLNRLEAKLQFSLKTKLAQDLLGGTADLWFGYTQQSYWQAGNTRYSSPFRETDYEPEIIAVQPIGFTAAGVTMRYAALSVTHESNGRGVGLSRSWNRLIGNVALESGPWSVEVRPWLRILERSDRDDNPDIEDFAGRGELVAAYRSGRNLVTLTGRHTLRGGERSRGSAQLDWSFPLAGALDGHLQLFSGYGENLIDYNHRQTTIGFGVSFFD